MQELTWMFKGPEKDWENTKKNGYLPETRLQLYELTAGKFPAIGTD